MAASSVAGRRGCSCSPSFQGSFFVLIWRDPISEHFPNMSEHLITRSHHCPLWILLFSLLLLFFFFTSSTKNASSPAMDWSAPGFGSGRTRSRRPADAARDATGLSQTGLAGTRARGSSPQPPRSRGRKRVPIVLSVTQTCRRGCRSRCSPDRGRDERGEVERSHTVSSYPRRRGGGQRPGPLCTRP